MTWVSGCERVPDGDSLRSDSIFTTAFQGRKSTTGLWSGTPPHVYCQLVIQDAFIGEDSLVLASVGRIVCPSCAAGCVARKWRGRQQTTLTAGQR